MSHSVAKARRRAAALFVAALLATGMTVAFLPASASADIVSPSPTDSPTPTDSPSPSPTDVPTALPPGSPWPTHPGHLAPWIRTGIGLSTVRTTHNGTPAPHRRRAVGRRSWKGWTPSTSWGTYSTALLDKKAARLRATGAAEAAVLRRVYRPFIVQGPATWSDSWHAPRFAGGFHLHEGQDVLCSYGAPVLAALDGTLSFGENTLGGLAAYITLPNGSFLYYAHLSRQRPALAGTRVHPGDVIGNCGATGDATVPHVHFSLYDANDVALNPMKLLVRLLHHAEQRSTGRHSAPNPAAQLPRGLTLEAPQPTTAPTVTLPPSVVYQSGVGVDGHAGRWDVLALIAAFAVILIPAGLMRMSKVRAAAGISDEP